VPAGGDLPQLLGVPFTVKGNIDLVGTPTTHGAMALAQAYPTRDAPVVERMRTGGAIPSAWVTPDTDRDRHFLARLITTLPLTDSAICAGTGSVFPSSCSEADQAGIADVSDSVQVRF
jgi:hypothetical protein